MRPLTNDETKIFFEALSKYIGGNIRALLDRKDGTYYFRFHLQRVYYVEENIMKAAMSIPLKALGCFGICFGKFTKNKKFRLGITCVDIIAPYALHKLVIKATGENNFLYGNNVHRAHILHDDTLNIPRNGGVVVFNTANQPLGFGAAARASNELKDADPVSVVVYHHADKGEYIRNESTLA